MGLEHRPRRLDPSLHLPVSLLARYLFFLARRPISRANEHFLRRRLRGLKSLVPSLLDAGKADLSAIAETLSRIEPGGFHRAAEPLLRRLETWVVQDLPSDVLVTHQPPGEAFLATVRNVHLVLAPGIGVGDEILCFPLARWLRERLGATASIVVHTAYDALWDRVPAATAVRQYPDLQALVDAVRTPSDLVLLVDFEKPALAAALSRETAVARYAEIALGARGATAWDAGCRRLHRTMSLPPAARNHYDALGTFARWLGAPPNAEDRWSGTVKPADPSPAPGRRRPRRMLVSPFTSKHEPSLAWWSRLVAGALPRDGDAVEVHVDTGPNLATERVAHALVRAIQPHAPHGTICRLATEGDGTDDQQPDSDGGARASSLGAVLGHLAAADIVLCTDSFAAHAAPHFGCLTLVVAGPGLEDWRVPALRSFYFDAGSPVDGLATAMRRLVTSNGGAPRGRAEWRPPGADDLVTATDQLADRLDHDLDSAAWRRAYGELVERLRAMLGTLEEAPEDLDTLFGDRSYHALLPPLPPQRTDAREHRGDAAEHDGLDADLRVHLRAHHAAWANSNLRKYLTLERAPAGEAS